MKLVTYFRALNYLFLLMSVKSDVGLQKVPILDTKSEWTNISQYLVSIMTKSQIMQDNGKLEVTIFLLNYPIWNSKYEGLQSTLSAFSTEQFLISSLSFPKLRQNIRTDFVIILTTPGQINYSIFVQNILRVMFVSKHTRFIVIVRFWSVGNQIINSIWSQLSSYGYFNVYIVVETSEGIFNVYRTEIKNQKHVTLSKIDQHSNDDRQLIIKDSQIYSDRPIIRIITYDFYPTTFVQDNKVYGIDGYLIEEFSQWLNTSYVIVHSWTSKIEIPVLLKYMQKNIDICLCADLTIYNKDVDGISLFETNGICLLVPRNIYVSSYENLSLPLDQTTLIISIVSAISLVICWKIISWHSEHRLTISEMLLAVLQLSFYTDAPDLDRLNLKEKMLIFSFMFGSFFISNLYESSILSFMMAEPSVRSARDLSELNNSNTKFYSFYDDRTAYLSKLPTIRKDLILNQINFSSSFSFDLPNDFDENLVYLVTCQFAENFEKTSKNYRNNHRLFDVRLLTQDYQRYTLRNGFPFIDEFSRFVSSTLEAGIRSYWKQKVFYNSSNVQKIARNTEKDFIEFQGMMLPIVVIIIGSLLAFFVFVLENVKYYREYIRLNMISSVHPAPQISQRKSKRINLRKWVNKYSRKDPGNCKISELSSREDVSKFIMNKKREIMKREKFPEGKLKGGYLVPKKLKQRTGRRIIRVVPINSEIMETEV